MTTKYNVTDGNDIFTLTGTPETINSGSGSDTFIINGSSIRNFVIDGGTNLNGDSIVKPAYFDAAGTKLSTVRTTLDTPNAIDTIKINKTANLTNLNFTHIERVDLANGVTATFTSGQLGDAISSLGDNGDNATGFNSGLHFYGVAGGKIETVKVIVEYQDKVFTPAATVVNAKPITYSMGDFQLDDASVGDLFHNVLHSDDFKSESDESSYARADGSNNADYGLGSDGVDNATLRLGNDTYLGGAGNDLLIGHQGVDSLDGGADDDIFLITSFGGALGAAGKADDGQPEWISGDVIIGGSGSDTLRITGGSAEKTIVTLTDKNFKSMEIVQIGGTVGRLNVEDAGLQLLNNHYYHDVAGSITGKDLRAGQTADNVIIDANAIKANGLTFIGNANKNTFIGTQKADTFIGNGSNDTFTGSAGADKFVFGKVHTQTVTGDATAIQTYQDVVSDLTGIDTITDFKSGSDKIALNLELFNVGASPTIKINPSYYLSFDNGFLLFDKTTHTLSYDSDANGAGASVALVVLTGVSNLTASDFITA
jgi:Ca2+-binding RTX toxin-like protein